MFRYDLFFELFNLVFLIFNMLSSLVQFVPDNIMLLSFLEQDILHINSIGLKRVDNQVDDLVIPGVLPLHERPCLDVFLHCCPDDFLELILVNLINNAMVGEGSNYRHYNVLLWFLKLVC